MNQIIVPRQSQIVAIRLAVQALEMTFRALVVMATGLGKTITSALIAQEVKARRVLFLVHSNFILEKSLREYRKVFGDSRTYALYNGLSKTGAETADFVFASFQTIGPNLAKWSRDHFDLVVVDESHHSHADTYRPTIEYFNALKLAITATPDREDALDIRTIFGSEVVNISLEEAVARNWLPPFEYHIVTDDGFDEEVLAEIAREVLDKGQRISMSELNRRVFVRAREEKVAKIIEGYKQKSLVFCETIDHANELQRAFKHAETFHSKKGTSATDTWIKNQSVLQAFEQGIVRHVLAVDAFNEGIDIPNIGLVAFCRSTKSRRVFKQQLGRGLHSNLSKLIVLDFVGNVERIQEIRMMFDEIAKLHEEHTFPKDRDREGYTRDTLKLAGTGFEFTFSDKLVDLIKVLRRIESWFYPTWQEAGEAARKLGITTRKEFKALHSQDHRLPSYPDDAYADFPKWRKFLETELYTEPPYPTWQEAGVAAQKIGIKCKIDYGKKFRTDPRLRPSPRTTYSRFPGWKKFLDTEIDFYPTWQEAGKAALKLGITRLSEYIKKRILDKRLPASPYVQYADFPGMEEFLGKRTIVFYSTWQEASTVAKALNIKSQLKYRTERSRDERLPSTPDIYPGFPGWGKFLGTNREKRKNVSCYSTWQEAGEAARQLGIRVVGDYAKKYKLDNSLSSRPEKVYSNWPGWTKFLGRA